METWIRRACRQRSYRIFITWVLLTIGLIAFNVGAKDYWANFFRGPYSLSLTDLEALHDVDPAREFVSVQGTKITRSGIQVITTEMQNGVKQSEYASSDYYVLAMGQRLLAINAKEQPNLTVSGELKPLPSNLASMIFPESADADMRTAFLPLMLDTTEHYRSAGYFSIAVMALFGLLFWKFAIPAFKQTQDITLHPVVRRVEGWTDAVDVTMQAEQEQSRAMHFKKSGIIITDNYVIARSFYSFNLLPFNHLVWAYRKATTRTIYFIPVARTSTAELIFSGGSATFPGPKKIVEEVLHYATARAPWAFLGYTEELRNAFKKDPIGFGRAIQERKAQLKQYAPVLSAGVVQPPPVSRDV